MAEIVPVPAQIRGNDIEAQSDEFADAAAPGRAADGVRALAVPALWMSWRCSGGWLMIKRQMYGRAKPDLLRKRVLLPD